MITISDAARDQFAEHFEHHEKVPIRVYMTSGCSGPRLVVAMDREKENDTVHELNGVQFLVEKTLLETAAPIKIDFVPNQGFTIASSLNLGGASDCASCCSSCSTCS